MPPEITYEFQGQRVSIPLEADEISIGRAVDNDVVISDNRISRRHAKIHRVGEAWRVTDLASSNGTFVNDGDPTDHDLRNGDQIQLHKFPITFVDEPKLSVALTSWEEAGQSEDLFPGTVVRSAIDFNTLASQQAETDVGQTGSNLDRLRRLLDIVTKVSEALLSSSSLADTLETVLDAAFEHLSVDRGCIMMWDAEKGDLDVRCVRQKDGKTGEIRFSRTIAEKVYREKVAVLTNDAMSDDRFAGGQSIIDLNIRSAMAAPLSNGERVEGLIYVDNLARVRAFDNFDLDVLSALGNHAAVAISQSRMQESILEQKLVRERLGRYHSPAVIEHITANRDGGTSLVADEREVTVLFADVVGFTNRCESMPAKDVADLLNRYFSEMAEVVFRHDGTLDKFIGDCMMAVFGAPMRAEDHAVRCAAAALDMRDALARLTAPLEASQRLDFRIGMHSGRVVAGDIGSVRRSDYTVLGATVNLAARLESSVAKTGQAVISDVTNELIQHAFETRFLGDHQPKGISRSVACYELVGKR